MTLTVETALMQLTGQEYGAVARLIKGDPRHALDNEHPIEDGTPCLACQAAEARP